MTKFARWLTILIPLLMLAGPAPADVVLFMVPILFIARSLHARDFRWLQPVWMKLILILWAYTVLRSAMMEDPWDAVLISSTWVRYPLFVAALAHWVLTDAPTRVRLWWACAAAVWLMVGDAFWQYITHVDWTGRPVRYLYSGAVRLTGPFSNPRLGLTTVFFLFPVLLLLYHDAFQRTVTRWPVLLLSAASIAAIFISGERMAFLFAGLGMGLAFLFYAPCRKLLVAVGVAALLVAVGMAAKDQTLIVRQVENSHSEIGDFANSTYGRTWQSAWRVAKAHPLIGIGYGAFQNECRKPEYGATDENTLQQRCPMHPHNRYFEWLVSYGIIGLGLFCAVLFIWAKTLWHNAAQWRRDPVAVGLVIAVTLHFWPLAAISSQFAPWAIMPFWLMLGWLGSLRMLDRAAR